MDMYSMIPSSFLQAAGVVFSSAVLFVDPMVRTRREAIMSI